jgi:hypothetical protein
MNVKGSDINPHLLTGNWNFKKFLAVADRLMEHHLTLKYMGNE